MILPSVNKRGNVKDNKVKTKQRLLVLVTIGMMAFIIANYATISEVPVESTISSNSVQPTGNPPSKSAIPLGKQVTAVNQVEQIMRDPFAKQPEVKEQKNDSGAALPYSQKNIPSAVPTMVPKQIAPSISLEKLRLTGIISNTERRLAVIRSGNKSQAYSLNEVIDTYKIIAIHDDSVVLANTTGKLVLRLELAGQKGG